MALSESQRTVAESLDNVAGSLQSDLIQPLEQQLEPNMKDLEVCQNEKYCKFNLYRVLVV